MTVKGGNYSNNYGGAGIGGNTSENGPGEACGTVLILTTGTTEIKGGSGQEGQSNDGNDIGGGRGTGGAGARGTGISKGNDNTCTVYGNLVLPMDVTIPSDLTVTIPGGNSLTVPEGMTLTVAGTLTVNGTLTNYGTLTNSGTITVQAGGGFGVDEEAAFEGNEVIDENLPEAQEGQGA